MFFVIGMGIALFLAFILWTKREKSIADHVLAALLLVSAVHLGLFYHHTTDLMQAFPHLLGLAVPIPLVYGPLLYLYTRALTQPNNFGKSHWWLHFLPAALLYVYMVPIFLVSAEEKCAIAVQGLPQDFYFIYLHTALFIISGFAYVLWAAWLLKAHKRRISHMFSNTEQINLDWLRYLIYSLGGIWVLVAWGNDTLIFTGAVLFILFIGYFGIKQVGIFTNRPMDFVPMPNGTGALPIDAVENDSIEKKKYQKSGLTEEQAAAVQANLAHLMATEKLYKNSELALTDLAARLDIHPNYLSQVINEKEGVSFYDYVNALRVDEFKRLAALPESQQYTILALAYECGFNSKSSFNRYFKKATDLSPSEYMKTLG
jgi:AraC-like DNA-binding protein